MKVAVLDDYQRVAQAMADWSSLQGCTIDFFHEPLGSAEHIVSTLAPYQVIVAMRERTRFPAAVIDALPQLRLFVTTGMNNRAVDKPALAARGIPLCGTPWAEDTTVELAWGLILSLAHAIPAQQASLRCGRWQSTIGTSLRGKTLGVLGLGTIGTKMARLAKAFQMRVIAYSPNLTTERAAAAEVEAVDKHTFFSQSDVLSVHLILSDTTRGIVGAAELALMKPSALLINTSRGPLVDEHALADALHRSALAGAACDVYSEEPIPPEHPLLAAPNTVLTPHIGYVTEEVYRAWFPAVIEDIQGYLAGSLVRQIPP